MFDGPIAAGVLDGTQTIMTIGSRGFRHIIASIFVRVFIAHNADHVGERCFAALSNCLYGFCCGSIRCARFATGSISLERELPGAPYVYTNRLVEGRVAFLEWTAQAKHARVSDGADLFLIEDGWIVAQTIHYTVDEQ